MSSQAAGHAPKFLPPERSFLLNEGERKYAHVVNSGLDRLSRIEPAAHVAFVDAGFRDDAGPPRDPSNVVELVQNLGDGDKGGRLIAVVGVDPGQHVAVPASRKAA